MHPFPDCYVWFGFTAADARVAAQIGRGTTADVQVYCWLGSHTWSFFFGGWSLLGSMSQWSGLDRSVSISKRLKYFTAVVSSVACFGSGHRAIYNSQLATLDVQFRKIMQINRWTAARSWLECGEVLHLWNERVKNFIANVHVNTWSYITCKNYWNLATHVTAFPAHRWVQRLPSWHPIGTRRVGRPRHTSESKLHAYCRYANLGSWRKVYDVLWNSHLPSFVNFCRMYIAVVYILCFLRVRLVTGSPQACRPDLKRPLVIVGFK